MNHPSMSRERNVTKGAALSTKPVSRFVAAR
jgi:hypothetical protein